MPLLALLRHGPTDWTAERRLQGRSDRPLSPAGRAAVARWRLPAEMARFEWVTSPLRRCVETTALLRRRLPDAGPLAVDPRLVEMSFGAWEGRILTEIRRSAGEDFHRRESWGLDFRAPGGESPRDAQARLRPWLADREAGGADTLAITHKGVIRALYALATGWTMRDDAPDRLADASAHLFRIAEGRLSVVSLNLALTAPADEAEIAG